MKINHIFFLFIVLLDNDYLFYSLWFLSSITLLRWTNVFSYINSSSIVAFSSLYFKDSFWRIDATSYERLEAKVIFEFIFSRIDMRDDKNWSFSEWICSVASTASWDTLSNSSFMLSWNDVFNTSITLLLWALSLPYLFSTYNMYMFYIYNNTYNFDALLGFTVNTLLVWIWNIWIVIYLDFIIVIINCWSTFILILRCNLLLHIHFFILSVTS